MTANKRCSVMLPPDLEARIVKLRKTDAYCTVSLSEIIRRLLDQALDQLEEEA